MSIVSNATALHARLLGLPKRAGLVQYQHSIRVIKTTYSEGSFLPVEAFYPVLPNPKVQPMPSRLVGTILSGDIIVTEKDLMATDIVMTHTEESLIGEWEIDGKRGYKLLQLIPKTTTYSAIVGSPIDLC